MSNRTKRLSNRRFGTAVELSQTVDGGLWNVLAYAVDLPGLAPGARITESDIDSVVRNFANYARVPVVIEHADTRPGKPREWAEPQGWVTEVRKGSMTRAGGVTVATLEGKVQLGDDAKLAVNGDPKNGVQPKWPWGSVTIFNDVDLETGTDLGATLFSFSLTAHPRLVDVPRLAAGAQVEAGYWYGEIDSRADLLECIRKVLDLPLITTEADTLAEIDKLAVVAASGDSSGINLESILREFRDALRLPALTTTDDVIAALRTALAALPSETTPTTMSRGPRGGAQETKPMKTMIMLAASLGLAFKDEADAETGILALAREAGDVRKALGTTSPADTAAKIAALSVEAAKVPGLEARVQKADEDAAARAAQDRKAHIDALVLARPELEPARGSLELHAERDWESFAKAYPLPSGEEGRQRAQDPKRLARVAGGPRSSAPANVGAGIGAGDVIEAAKRVQAESHARGVPMTFSQALAEIEGDRGASTPSPRASASGGEPELESDD